MYVGALVMLIGTPLALGSYWAFVCVILLTGFVVWRLLDEERFLSRELPNYAQHRARFRYHLIPYVW